jgi:hypothetical protein
MPSREIVAMEDVDGFVISTTWSRALKGTPTEGTSTEGTPAEGRVLSDFTVGGSLTTRDQNKPDPSEGRAWEVAVCDESAHRTRRQNSSDEFF